MRIQIPKPSDEASILLMKHLAPYKTTDDYFLSIPDNVVVEAIESMGDVMRTALAKIIRRLKMCRLIFPPQLSDALSALQSPHVRSSELLYRRVTQPVVGNTHLEHITEILRTYKIKSC